MSMKLMALAMDVKVGNPLRKLVLLKLCDNANDKGECWPSFQHIADQCEISRRSVINHIQALQDEGYLAVQKRGKDGEQISNLYVVSLEKKTRISGAGDSPASAGNSLGVVQHVHSPSAADSPPGAAVAPPPSAADAPGISHSFEPVNEPVIEPIQSKPEYPVWFVELWKIYPPRSGASDKRKALHAAQARIKSGRDPDFLIAAVKRYAQFVQANGNWGTQYVMQAATFLGPGEHIDNPWRIPDAANQQRHVASASLGKVSHSDQVRADAREALERLNGGDGDSLVCSAR